MDFTIKSNGTSKNVHNEIIDLKRLLVQLPDIKLPAFTPSTGMGGNIAGTNDLDIKNKIPVGYEILSVSVMATGVNRVYNYMVDFKGTVIQSQWRNVSNQEVTIKPAIQVILIKRSGGGTI